MKKSILSLFIGLSLPLGVKKPCAAMQTLQNLSSYTTPVVEALWPHTWYGKAALAGSGIAFGISFINYKHIKGGGGGGG